MRVGYLVHDLNDAAVLRRARMLEMGGAQVALAGFTRETPLREAIAARNPLALGQSQDAAFLRRAAGTLKEALFTGSLKRHFEGCDLVMARNLEQLAIAARIAGGRALVYECLDIHRLLLESSPPARAIQALEGALLPRCDLLVTSSPAFMRHHFDTRPLKAPVELVENKLLLDPLDPPATPRTPPQREGPITIGWFGMLRCKRTLAFLEELTHAAQGRIEVLIAGKPSSAELPDLVERVRAHPGMRFHGSYTYADLPGLYGQCDLAWSVDWFEEGLNSQWLLPNRLYEAITYGCVPIALSDVEVGRWLREEDAGVLVEDAAQARDTLLAMTREDVARHRAKVEGIDPARTTASTADCAALVDRLRSLVA